MNRISGENPSPSVQEAVEEVMHRHTAESRWEAIYLFSSDGLVMAQSGRTDMDLEAGLLQFVFALTETVVLLDKNRPSGEICIRTADGRRLIFRFFTAFGETLILSAVTRGRKGHIRAMNNLIRRLHQMDRFNDPTP